MFARLGWLGRPLDDVWESHRAPVCIRCGKQRLHAVLVFEDGPAPENRVFDAVPDSSSVPRSPRPTFAALVAIALGVACGPSVPKPRDGRGSETSTTVGSRSSSTSAIAVCEATKADEVEFCFGDPSEDGTCVCTGDCVDESVNAATQNFGGNCCYTPLDVSCAALGDAGLCCYTVRVEIECGTSE